MGALICAATATEAKACRLGVENAGFGPKDFEVLTTGVGFEKVRAALKERLENGPKPELIISSGFAGALSPAIPVHSWVTAEKIFVRDCEPKDDTRALPLKGLVADYRNALSCNMISAAQLTKQTKEPVASVPAPSAADMESAVIASVAEEKGIRCLVLRMITDTPNEPLPDFVASFAGAMAATTAKEKLSHGFRGLTGVLRKPRDVVSLIVEGRNWSQQLQDGWTEHAAFVSDLFKLEEA